MSHTTPGGNDVRETSKVIDELNEFADNAGHKARHYFDTYGNKVSQASQSLACMIKEKPVQSSVIALGIGVLLGKIFRGSR